MADYHFWQSIDGGWKQLKRWVMYIVPGSPSDKTEGSFWYDSTSKKPKYYNGTSDQEFGITNHNQQNNIDGGDPVNNFYGHLDESHLNMINHENQANGMVVTDSNNKIDIHQIPIDELAVLPHNDLAELQGGDPTNKYYGHNTELMQNRQENAGNAGGYALLDNNNTIPINNISSLLKPVIYNQSSASTIWGPIINPFGRPCTVEIIDSGGNEMEADIIHDSQFTTVTIYFSAAMSGTAILT